MTPSFDNATPDDREDLVDQPLPPAEGEPYRLTSWEELRGSIDPRVMDAHRRLIDLNQTLYDLYIKRGVSDQSLYPIPPESLEPDWMGPEEDGFPGFAEKGDGMFLESIGRFVAAMGGYLELNAVFPDQTVTLMTEPGPERLHDGAN